MVKASSRVVRCVDLNSFLSNKNRAALTLPTIDDRNVKCRPTHRLFLVVQMSRRREDTQDFRQYVLGQCAPSISIFLKSGSDLNSREAKVAFLKDEKVGFVTDAEEEIDSRPRGSPLSGGVNQLSENTPPFNTKTSVNTRLV
jgi:hypothetical protein